jgi:hypothetical protein
VSTELERADTTSGALAIRPGQTRFEDAQIAALRHIGADKASMADLDVFFHQTRTCHPPTWSPPTTSNWASGSTGCPPCGCRCSSGCRSRPPTSTGAAMDEDQFAAVWARALDIVRLEVGSDITFTEDELLAVEIGLAAGISAVIEHFVEVGVLVPRIDLTP